MNPQRHERFQPVRHRWRLDGEQLRGELTGELVGGLQARLPSFLRTSRNRPRSADCARGRASRSSAAPRGRRTADQPAPQSDSTPPSFGSRRTARRYGLPCAAGGPRRAPGRAAGLRRAVRPAACRHLHGVQVQMQHAGVFAARRGGQRIVEDPLGLHHPRSGAGSPVLVSHSAHAVTLTSASAASACTSTSSGYASASSPSRRRSGVPGRQRSVSSGSRWGSGPAAPRSARVRLPRRAPLPASPSSIRARASEAARSTGSNASQALL